MSRKGLNIYKRKDGRWEARYIKSRTAQGKPLYGYLYASSYHEARNRLQDVIRLQGNAPNSKEMSKGSVFEFFSIEWLDTFSTSFKESTYIRYRTLIRCLLPKIGWFGRKNCSEWRCNGRTGKGIWDRTDGFFRELYYAGQ